MERVATLTFSDTRTSADDEGGRLLGALLGDAGFAVLSHAIVREEREALTASVLGLCRDPSVDAVVCTGGTGVAPRDIAIEAIAPLFDKTLEGFGEAFRRLSWDQIGPRAILSRATAGFVAAGEPPRPVLVVLLPGSPKAVRLGVESLLAPTLGHAVALARGVGGHHHGHDHGPRGGAGGHGT
ncbi:MAG: molybdenum cofactor biosynthesis protein MoaB [Polyangiaceae bacterium]|nr:molybdenum cofactor biosynthesis protein MoaB [Polyangiaceae bacterium]